MSKKDVIVNTIIAIVAFITILCVSALINSEPVFAKQTTESEEPDLGWFVDGKWFMEEPPRLENGHVDWRALAIKMYSDMYDKPIQYMNYLADRGELISATDPRFNDSPEKVQLSTDEEAKKKDAVVKDEDDDTTDVEEPIEILQDDDDGYVYVSEDETPADKVDPDDYPTKVEPGHNGKKYGTDFVV